MFIDYLSLLLVNMAIGFVMVAMFALVGLGSEHPKRFAPGFAMVGLVAFLFGLHLCWTWPLPGPYNMVFGETSVLLGTVFLGAALAVGLDWGLQAVAVYALFAGVAAIILGARIIHQGLTAKPVLSGIGFILSGAGGVLVGPVLAFRKRYPVRLLLALVLLGAAAIWLLTCYAEYWMHAGVANFKDWKPATMR